MSTSNITECCEHRAPGALARVGAVLGRLEQALRVRRGRRELMTLDERTLKDIGISRADAEREAGRRLWDID